MKGLTRKFGGISRKNLENEVNELTKKTTSHLELLLKSSDRIKEIKEKKIRFAPPVLNHNDKPVFHAHTINVVQGQAGVHKSRLAELICSAMLKRIGTQNDLLGFKRNNFDSQHTVVYVDTERNQSDQFPFALQKIQTQAGYDVKEHPPNFKYISLIEIDRKDRFSALKEYLAHLTEESDKPLFIVLDVSTDCIEDFNRTDKSMQLIDQMNMAINDHNVIFLCLIHENPGTEKARGHFGTELKNKASTVIQVGFEKGPNSSDSSLVKISYLKCRSSERYPAFYAKYCKEIGTLKLASSDEIQEVAESRKQKASISSILKSLRYLLGNGESLSRQDILETLSNEFEASDRTIETRLKEIIKEEKVVLNSKEKDCLLVKSTVSKTTMYRLAEIVEK